MRWRRWLVVEAVTLPADLPLCAVGVLDAGRVLSRQALTSRAAVVAVDELHIVDAHAGVAATSVVVDVRVVEARLHLAGVGRQGVAVGVLDAGHALGTFDEVVVVHQAIAVIVDAVVARLPDAVPSSRVTRIAVVLVERTVTVLVAVGVEVPRYVLLPFALEVVTFRDAHEATAGVLTPQSIHLPLRQRVLQAPRADFSLVAPDVVAVYHLTLQAGLASGDEGIRAQLLGQEGVGYTELPRARVLTLVVAGAAGDLDHAGAGFENFAFGLLVRDGVTVPDHVVEGEPTETLSEVLKPGVLVRSRRLRQLPGGREVVIEICARRQVLYVTVVLHESGVGAVRVLGGGGRRVVVHVDDRRPAVLFGRGVDISAAGEGRGGEEHGEQSTHRDTLSVGRVGGVIAAGG